MKFISTRFPPFQGIGQQLSMDEPAMENPFLASHLEQVLKAEADAKQAAHLRRFFKTASGQYGHGDVFLGIRVPRVRFLVRPYHGLPLDEIKELLLSPCHEIRLSGLILLVKAMESRGGNGMRAGTSKRDVFDTYRWAMDRERINNWDLVDLSAPHVVGRYLHDHEPSSIPLLHEWAESSVLWTRRIAIVATFHFIRRNHLETTLAIARKLIQDREDLIQKATGWMLREVGKKDAALLEAFLESHCRIMPRTMLRYALEKFPAERKAVYL